MSAAAADGDACTRAAELREAGTVAYRAGEYAKANQLYTEALTLQPRSAQLLSNRCAARTGLGKHHEALQDAEAADKISPSPRTLVRRAAALSACGRHADAVACGRDGVARFPGDVLVAAALERAKSAQADAALKVDVVDFAVNKTNGEAALRSKDYAAAEANYAKTIATMEGLLARLPHDQSAPMRAKIEALRAKMKIELGEARTKYSASR